MASRRRKTARAGLRAFAWLSATVASAQPSVRIGYVLDHEAAIIATDPAGLVATVAPPAEAELLEGDPSDGAIFRLSGWNPGEPTTLELVPATGGTPTRLQLTPPPRPPQSLRIKLTGAIPSAADPADLELAAAGLQSQDAAATVSIGGLFAFEDNDRLSAAAYERAARRRLQAPSWQGVWRAGANYGVLGALDYGPSSANRHWSNRTAALDAFARFWPTPNRPLPTTPATYEFSLGEVACFVLDGFSQADGVEQPAPERAILGRAQREWLANALALSDAPFKLVFCGRPLLVPSEKGIALHRFDEATRQFLKIFDGPGTDGVVLVTGGGPVGELTRVIRPSGYPLNELSLGPLTRSFDAEEPYQELNYFRVPGTLVREPHFSAIEVAGPADGRSLRLSTHHLDGTEIWAETVAADELRN